MGQHLRALRRVLGSVSSPSQAADDPCMRHARCIVMRNNGLAALRARVEGSRMEGGAGRRKRQSNVTAATKMGLVSN